MKEEAPNLGDPGCPSPQYYLHEEKLNNWIKIVYDVYKVGEEAPNLGGLGFPSLQFYSIIFTTALKLEIQEITQERKRGWILVFFHD